MSAVAVKERPIRFTAEEVRAVLNGRKTMTRRIVKPPRWANGEMELDADELIVCDRKTGWFASVECPFGKPGDRLWVRESMRYSLEHDNLYFVADNKGVGVKRYCDLQGKFPRKSIPSIHMPRWASRITLEITSVRVERLQEISQADAIAEGIHKFAGDLSLYGYDPKGTPGPMVGGSAAEAFGHLWNSVYGADAWERNDWVWALGFRRVS